MKQDIEPTIQDVLVAVNTFATTVDERLTNIETTMVTKDEFYRELDQIRGRLAQTVTKDYLDDKLADLRSEFVIRLRHRPKLAK